MSPTITWRRLQPRLARGIRIASAMAATRERKLATCQLLRVLPLIAAPPVENSSAAANTHSLDIRAR